MKFCVRIEKSSMRMCLYMLHTECKCTMMEHAVFEVSSVALRCHDPAELMVIVSCLMFFGCSDAAELSLTVLYDVV